MKNVLSLDRYRFYIKNKELRQRKLENFYRKGCPLPPIINPVTDSDKELVALIHSKLASRERHPIPEKTPEELAREAFLKEFTFEEVQHMLREHEKNFSYVPPQEIEAAINNFKQ